MTPQIRAALRDAFGLAFDAGVQAAEGSHATRSRYRDEQQDAGVQRIAEQVSSAIERGIQAVPERLPIRTVSDHVAAAYGLPPRLLTAAWRRRDIVEARHVAMWIARTEGLWPLSIIGRVMGGRDHTSVMHAVASVEARRAADPDFSRRTDSLVAELTNATKGEY